MSSDLERISAIWREQSGSYYEQLADAILARGGPSYATIARDQLLVSCQLVVTAWQTALDTNESTSIREFGTLIGRRRSEGHIAIDDIMRVVDILREGVLQALTRAYPGSEWNSAIATRCEDWLHELRNSIVSSYGVTLQAAEEGLAEREEAMAAQRRLIQELSTPIVPIHEGVLVLPIIGTIDSRRATQILEAALERIVAAQAEILILDITGVPYIDTSVANYLLQTVRAVTLLGAQSVLVGIGTEIAQTLVHLGVDLSGVIVRANLQEGIVYALHHMGMAIQPLNSRV